MILLSYLQYEPFIHVSRGPDLLHFLASGVVLQERFVGKGRVFQTYVCPQVLLAFCAVRTVGTRKLRFQTALVPQVTGQVPFVLVTFSTSFTYKSLHKSFQKDITWNLKTITSQIMHNFYIKIPKKLKGRIIKSLYYASSQREIFTN